MPADTVVMRLVVGFSRRLVTIPLAPPAAAIPVPVPDHGRSISPPGPRPPDVPILVDRWEGSLRCVGSPRTPDCHDETIAWVFTSFVGPTGRHTTEVSWTLEGGSGPRNVHFRSMLKGRGCIGNADVTEAGIAARWDCEVLGDTLAGQLVDVSSCELLRELRAHRVQPTLPENPRPRPSPRSGPP